MKLRCQLLSMAKRSFTLDPLRYGASRRRATQRVAAALCNTYGKFQRESGDGGAVLCRDVPGRIRCERTLSHGSVADIKVTFARNISDHH